MSTVWNKLSVIDVSEHVEKKNGMSYLSWAYAWQTLKDNFPDATFEKHCNDMGYPCFYDPAGFAFVKVTVSAGGHSQTETFPVLDFKNKGVQGPDSFQVNTALQRALTKAIGYLGLASTFTPVKTFQHRRPHRRIRSLVLPQRDRHSPQLSLLPRWLTLGQLIKRMISSTTSPPPSSLAAV